MYDVVKWVSTMPSAGSYQSDGQPAEVSVKMWAPSWMASGQQPVAILQLNHGMAEYIDRYDVFARAVASMGWLVVGMDFLGHGDSVTEASQLGYTGVALPDGRNLLIEDMHGLRVLAQTQYPGIPYFMFAHSMGSFVLRAYLGEHGDGLSGAVISGTGSMAPSMVAVAKGLLGMMGLFHKPDYRSAFFASMSVGPYNKPFAKDGGARTPCDWLSRDTQQVDKYVDDPRCGFTFSLAADRLLIDAAARANALATYESTPKNLPLLMVSGGNDPVGGMGKGVREVRDTYIKVGMQDITLDLYTDARHELLNELNRDTVTSDIIAWLDDQAGRIQI